MFYIADLHVHSHFSRATSKDMNLESLYQWARIKGIQVVGTGDFTHPKWFRELREKLEPDGNGLFRLKNPPSEPGLPGIRVTDTEVRFCLSAEISSIYKDGDKVRKNHNLVFAPDFDTVARINARLSAIGNLKADGRPILGLPSHDLLGIVSECSDRAYLVPAHVWTPWFSTLGSKGGYDSIDECFRDLTGQIFALETGLSSDPEMNWKWSALDRFTLISNSDAHSAPKLGREANLFDTELSYDGLFSALKTRQGFLGTYEFFPEEGKYHLDGHRKCGISLTPQETRQYNGICPACGKPLTVGVLNRVETLSDRSEPQKPEGAAGFKYLIPLPEILAEIKGSGSDSKIVMQAFHQAISSFGNEFTLLEKIPVEEITRQGDPLLAEAIRRMRGREVKPQAGYDGEYGIIHIFDDGELARLTGQLHLFGMPETKRRGRTRSVRANATQDTDQNPDEKTTAVPPKGNRLNEAQKQVQESVNGAVLVKAGPGTGKTSTLIQWIGKQIQSGQAKAPEVLAITFTNKAAREIRDRLTSTLGNKAGQVVAGTFHAIAYRMLQERYPDLLTVYDGENRLSVIRILFPDLKENECKKLSAALATFFELNEDAGFEELQKYAASYRQYVREQGAIDLADIMQQLVSLWKQEPGELEKRRTAIRSIAVDELQDINALQYEFITLLGQGKNILAIGDPDQSIYGFRGSDLRLFFRFATDFNAKEISLTENYRSVPSILKAAGGLIRQDTLRSDIELQPVRKGRQKIRLYQACDPVQEARFIAGEIEKKVGGFNLLSGGTSYDEGDYAFSDLAVLYRTHQVGHELLSCFKNLNLPLIPGDGTSFLGSEPFSLIASMLKLLLHPSDRIALDNILGHLPGWNREDVSRFLSQLHEKKQDWQSATPEQVNAAVAESFAGWKNFCHQLAGCIETEGVTGGVKEICRIYLPDTRLTEEQLLKKEAILALAGEADTDVRQFLDDATLNNYTDTGRQQSQGIHLLTFHAAKGLEFPVVFIAGAEEGITPSGRKDSDEEEERRLFYVAMTRARDELYITHSAKRIVYGEEKQQQLSRFVQGIPAELTKAVLPESRSRQSRKDDGAQLSLF